ncbi:hypothetical protein M422DRAFT_207101 [Sphaerobolus stellatus SS14]|uniref:Uncharacterized protein n=1 Tax=Sphaerobolus stellatus (strain SS14) TaxID=990650 RepID=A0A0C9VFG0_SPHS4|nr:hypothetical protein M422DRAFT_207101 [Sphaerobolus stellatus SS14]
MPSVVSAINELVNSIISIFTGLIHSVLAIFQAILGLGTNVVKSVVDLAQSMIKAVVDITGDTIGLLWGNLFIIAILGGGYYLYTTKSANRSSGSSKRIA